MKKVYLFYFFIVFLISGGEVSAQLVVTPCSAIGQTPQQFIQNQLVGVGVTISNATFNGSSAVITSDQLGAFTATDVALTELGLSAGMILTSGAAINAIGPNITCSQSTALNTPGDADLTTIAGVGTHDACVIEFDFIPQSDTLKFRYEFGSEEIYTYYHQFNDAFGFFLSGPGITGPFSNNSVNIALMPGSSNYVTINNICDDPSANWCNSPISCPYNQPLPAKQPPAFINCQNPHGNGGFLQYNGFSWIFTAWHIVTPCQIYHIKIAIADAGDPALDSGVFLEKNSFSASAVTVNHDYSLPQLGPVAVEGCSNATVNFRLQAAMLVNDTINYTIGGTATNGVDYPLIPSQVIIPAGIDSAFIVINPLMDNIAEGTETVILGVSILNCNGGSTYYDTVYIQDNFTLTCSVGNDTSVCQGQSVTLHALHSGGQGPYSYLWSNGSTLSQITVTPPLGNIVYYCTVSDACSASVTDTVVVHATDHPLVTNPVLISTTCNGSPAGIVPQSNFLGATYIWTASCSDPNISGYSAGAGLFINQILFNSGTTIDTVIYHVSANANGCISLQPKDFKVAVIPSVDAYFQPAGQSVCNGGNISISILSHTAGTNFSWTFTYGSPNLSGALNGNTSTISQTLFNSGFTTDTVTYHVIPANSGCPGGVYNVKAAVYPVPDVWSVPASQSICSGSPTSLNLFSHVTGALFSWTATCPSPNVSGYSASSGTSIAQPLVNSGSTSEIVTYTVTPTANGCPGSPVSIQVTVKPSPVLTSGTSFPLCSGGLTTIVLQANPSGGTFSWTATGSSPQVSGYANGVGGTISQNLVNSGFNIETVTYHVIPALNGCSGPNADVTVTVSPFADVYFTPTGQTICSGTAPVIGLNSHVSSPTFTWTATGSSGNITGFGPGAGNTINQVLVNSGYTVETVTYIVTPYINNCPGSPGDVTIIVNPLPATSFTACTDIITTTDAMPFTLKGGLPLGGVYTGAGVAAGNFSPAIAGAGAHTLTYTCGNVYGCNNSSTLSISVQSPAAFTCDNTFNDVRDNQPYNTISIGAQCWMAVNLNFGGRILSSSMQRDNCVVEKYCLNDLAANCTASGGLYQWDELMQYDATQGSQGLCPPAWHVPSENEWNVLFGFYLGNGFAGAPLKYSGYSGFNALLSGIRFNNANWNFDSFASFFWSSTSHGPAKAWAHAMNFPDQSAAYYPANRSDAFYVRCIKN